LRRFQPIHPTLCRSKAAPPSSLSIHICRRLLSSEPSNLVASANQIGRIEINRRAMKYLLATMVLLTGSALALPAVGPPERHFHVSSTGDVYEWQPGFGIIVVRARIETRTRRVSDGKNVVELERTTRIKRDRQLERPFTERPRANDRARDDAESFPEQVAPAQ
jgi:hypothetical protein